MDYGKILTRSFEITTRYRALWVFGLLLALFGGGINFRFPGDFGGGRGGSLPAPQIPTGLLRSLGPVIVAGVLLLLVWLVLSIVLRFLSRGALIGLVQELEADGTSPSVRHGFSIGASRFWPLLGIAVTINLPLAILSLALVILAALPALAAILPAVLRGGFPADYGGPFAAGIVGSVALLCCAGLALWVISLVVEMFYEFMMRECVLHKCGVLSSIREGYRRVRSNLAAVAVLYLLMIGIGIIYLVATVVAAIVLIALVVGIGLAVGLAANAAVPGILAGVVLGIPVLALLIFVRALYMTFQSAVWTQAYLAISTPPNAAVGA